MKYRLTSAAERELNRVMNYYESQLPGLGGEFLTEVERTVSLVTRNPRVGTVYMGDVRRCLTRRFPFSLFCRIAPDCIDVIAIAGNRREPGYWNG
ncbi:MAG: type II toxin-antitoxin system RelE/ParE family toxin [Gammaproteobacteria bacterium]|nr:type II toxin-antitoxin system RelE/ParE family toxin [Gammaproteobacteria bacterium]